MTDGNLNSCNEIDADSYDKWGDHFFEKKQDFERAENCYRQALRLDPAHKHAGATLLWLFRSLVQRGTKEEYQGLLFDTLDLQQEFNAAQSQNPHFLFHVAMAFERNKLYSKAVFLLEKCEEHIGRADDDYKCSILQAHGDCLWALGNQKAAVAKYKELNDFSETEYAYNALIKCCSDDYSFEDQEGYMRKRLWKDRCNDEAMPLPDGFGFLEQCRCLAYFYAKWSEDACNDLGDVALAREKIEESLKVAQYAVDTINTTLELDMDEDLNGGVLDEAQMLLWTMQERRAAFNVYVKQLPPPEDGFSTG